MAKRRRSHHLVVGQNYLRSLSRTVDEDGSDDNNSSDEQNPDGGRSANARSKMVTFDETLQEEEIESTSQHNLDAILAQPIKVPHRKSSVDELAKTPIEKVKSRLSIISALAKLTGGRSYKRSVQATTSSVDSLDDQSSAGETSISIAYTKGEVRFVDTVADINQSSDRVCFISPLTSIPLVISSWVSYRTPSQIKSAQRTRHISSSSSDLPGLRPFAFRDEEVEEVSYRHLLVPYRFRLSRNSPGYRSVNKRRLISEESEPDTLVNNKKVNLAMPEIYCSRSSSVEPQASKNDDSCSSSSYKMEQGPDLTNYFMYDMNILNNAQFGAAHHKMTFRFPFYTTSVIEYIDSGDFKQEINDKFKLKFPQIQLTYSKFKSLKREMREICDEADADLLTVASAHVYFEKLVLKALVNKDNRKCIAGVCILLAAKFNDTRGSELTELIEAIESSFRLSRKELMDHEIPVIVALDFNLRLPDYEVYQHYQHMQSGINL